MSMLIYLSAAGVLFAFDKEQREDTRGMATIWAVVIGLSWIIPSYFPREFLSGMTALSVAIAAGAFCVSLVVYYFAREKVEPRQEVKKAPVAKPAIAKPKFTRERLTINRIPHRYAFEDPRCKKLYALYHGRLVNLHDQGSDLWKKADALLTPIFVNEREFAGVRSSLIKSVHHDTGDARFTPAERKILAQEIVPLIKFLKQQPA